jgi:hypothetical protein
MSFQTSQPDLSTTIFRDSDLQIARKFLQDWISREMPSWLNKPQGPFGEDWKRDDVQATCRLIDLAHMIDLVTSHATPQSIPILNKKVRENLLRRPSDIQQFYEALTELQVAFMLTSRVSPLTLEPDIPKQSKAPDIAFQLPGGLVYLDVTVFRGGPLDKWEQSIDRIKRAIGKRIIKRKKALSLKIRLPFENTNVDQIISQVLEKIDEDDTGEVAIGDKGIIHWEPFPATIVPEGKDISEMSSIAASSTGIGAFHGPSTIMDIAVGFSTDIAASSPEDRARANELLLKSISTKLKEKHDQFPPHEQSLYVIKLGHWRLITNQLIDLIHQRIWIKDDYRWITGIIFFRPRQGYSSTDKGSEFILNTNPRAKCPATQSLESLFNNNAQFHYQK